MKTGNCCSVCPHKDKCKARANDKKHKSTVRVTGKMVARARQARNFSTGEGKADANRRNGVEGVMSVMRRKYDVDHIPVFGLKRLKTWIWTTLLSYNLVKYQKYSASLEKKQIWGKGIVCLFVEIPQKGQKMGKNQPPN